MEPDAAIAIDFEQFSVAALKIGHETSVYFYPSSVPIPFLRGTRNDCISNQYNTVKRYKRNVHVCKRDRKIHHSRTDHPGRCSTDWYSAPQTSAFSKLKSVTTMRDSLSVRLDVLNRFVQIPRSFLKSPATRKCAVNENLRSGVCGVCRRDPFIKADQLNWPSVTSTQRTWRAQERLLFPTCYQHSGPRTAHHRPDLTRITMHITVQLRSKLAFGTFSPGIHFQYPNFAQVIRILSAQC